MMRLLLALVLGAAVAASADFCIDLKACDYIWESGSAFACVDNECKCAANSTFRNRRCECYPGFVRYNRQCVASQSSRPCTTSNDCSGVDNSECDIGKRVCTCKTDFVDVNNWCREVARNLGAGCEDVKQCTPNLGPNVECLNNQCVCKSGDYVAASVNGQQQCLQKQYLNADCQVPEQCDLTPNSTCIDGRCACKPGFNDALNTKCVPNKRIGEECTEMSQCSKLNGELAGCWTKKCECGESNYYNGSWCLRKNGLRESCSGKDQGCYMEDGGYENIECYQGFCRCKNGKESADGNTCGSSGVERVLVSVSLFLAALVSSTYIL